MANKKGIKGKLLFILFVFTIGLASMAVRVGYLKIVHGAEYETAAKEQRLYSGQKQSAACHKHKGI